jgi:Tfp pilus assembly protein PilF
MRASFAIVAFLLLAMPAFPAAIPLPSNDARWTTITIGDLTIYSDARDSTTRELAERMHRMRETVAHVTGLPLRVTLPTRVFIFRSDAELAPYRTAAGQARGADGLFIAAPLGNYVAVSTKSAADVDRIVYHELAHSIIRGLGGNLPPWLVEGLAELFSTFNVSRDVVIVGLPVINHTQWLNGRSLVNVREIVDPPPGSIDFNDEKPGGIFYGESWALTHFLLLGDTDRRPQLAEYLSLLAAQKSPEDAFTKAFGTYDAVTTQLRQYMSTMRRQSRRISLSELHATTIPEPAPLARDELLFALGDFLTNGTRDDGAEELLQEALRLNPSHTGAMASLGTLLERIDRRVEAAELFGKAVKLGSHDSRVHVLYGESLLARFGATQRGGGDVRAHEVDQARALFDVALKLDENNPLAWAGRGATYLFTRENAQPGIDALEKSLALAPGQIDVATNLVFLYARARRRNEAQRLIERVVEPAGDPSMLAVARDNLLAADILDAGDLLNASKKEEALKLLRPAMKVASTERLRKQISRMIDRALR